MTFRDVARRYLGWCPGFNRVASYPLKQNIQQNYRLVVITSAITIGLFIAASAIVSPPYPISPGGPLQIYITSGPKSGVYPDSTFNQTFDYAGFSGAKFFEPVNDSEYAHGSQIEVNTYQFATLEEVYNTTLSLSMPNAVRQYVLWLISQDYNSTSLKARGYVLARSNDGLGSDLGWRPPMSGGGFARYIIDREANYGGIHNNEDFTGAFVLTDGVSLVQYSGKDAVWYLGIDGCMESPFTQHLRYRVRIVHYTILNNWTIG
jgi:hypothetical protein